jgi:hypothetical protein
VVVVVGRQARKGADEAISPKRIQPRTMPTHHAPIVSFPFWRGLMGENLAPYIYIFFVGSNF